MLHQSHPYLLRLVFISSMSSQGQALSLGTLCSSLPLLLLIPLSFPHRSPPTLTLCLPLYTLSCSPFLLPFSPFSSLLLLQVSLFPLFLLSLVPSPPFPCSLSHSLSVSIFPFLLPPPPPPAPTGALCVSKLCGWQPEYTAPHPPTHAQLGRSSHGSETLPSHHPGIPSHSPAISFCCPSNHHRWT